MTEQEKIESVSELLKQLEDSLNREVTELNEEVEEYKKRAEQSREQYSAKQYQDQCDEIATAFEAHLAAISADLELVRQAKAKLQ